MSKYINATNKNSNKIMLIGILGSMQISKYNSLDIALEKKHEK